MKNIGGNNRNSAPGNKGKDYHKAQDERDVTPGGEMDFENYFEMINQEKGIDRVDVDQAWNKLSGRLKDENLLPAEGRTRINYNLFARIAALIVIVVATTFTIKLINGDNKGGMLLTSTGENEKNVLVKLADGSSVTLNRNSSLTYPEKFGRGERSVTLVGEAFFEITPDPLKPFVVDAGNGEVKVLGTSFNVITSNTDNEIEVFVSTGRVMLSSNDGTRQVELDPGYIGKLSNSEPVRETNDNPNYMAWNTEILRYEGTPLSNVFEDLKRVHNISVEVESDSILDHRISTVYNNNSPETIIISICTTFNLNFEKKDEIYYLSR